MQFTIILHMPRIPWNSQSPKEISKFKLRCSGGLKYDDVDENIRFKTS